MEKELELERSKGNALQDKLDKFLKLAAETSAS
jgi:hypothetical protein